MTNTNLQDLVAEVLKLREQEAQVKAEKEAKEIELATALQGHSSTVTVGDFKVTQRPTLTYKLNDAGMEVMNTIPFTDKLWKKSADAKSCQADPRFTPDMIIVTEGKVALTIKSAE